jgi:CMP-N,N'-diacetyllegionaminic acid synthase
MKYSNAVVAIIPARSGSRTIPHKNIRDFAGRPLIAHSIEQALGCREISRTIVSTDSPAYADVARKYGAETPFLRPAEISGDTATDLEAFQHALHWLQENEGCVPELVVHLRPTHPNRTSDDISRAVNLIRTHPEWDSVRSVVPAPDTPFKMWFLEPPGHLRPAVSTEIPEAHSLPRQILPQAYLQNANVDVVRSRTILELNSMSGARIGGFIMSDFHDIDNGEQLHAAEAAFLWPQGLPRDKTFVFDIDGVIATIVPGNDYTLAEPMVDNIRRINRLHAAGNRIVLQTARGSLTGIDWSAVTRKQLSDWGVLHHALHFGKPAADYYVDDRMLSLQTLAMIDTLE